MLSRECVCVQETLIRLAKHWHFPQNQDHMFSSFICPSKGCSNQFPGVHMHTFIDACTCVRALVCVCGNVEGNRCWWFDKFALQTQPNLASKNTMAHRRWWWQPLFIFSPFNSKSPPSFASLRYSFFSFCLSFLSHTQCVKTPEAVHLRLTLSFHRGDFPRLSNAERIQLDLTLSTLQ